MFSKKKLIGFIGNICEHYDSALYGLLAPFIASIFFDPENYLFALIKTYALLPIGLLTKPLGSLFFGWIGDRWGRKESLILSLSGMAFATLSIGFLPTYEKAGVFSSISLATFRALQTFCASGELIGGALLVLEKTETPKRGFISSLFDGSTVIGILFASAVVAFFSQMGWIESYWRVLFWIGGLTALIGASLRVKQIEKDFSPLFSSSTLKEILQTNKLPFLSIILVSGFSYTTYSLSFTLMNGYVPLVTNLTKTSVIQVNTLLLIFDFLFLLFFGSILLKVSKEALMILSGFLSMCLAIPLFHFLDHATMGEVIIIRTVIIFLGCAFSAPYHAWAMELVPKEQRFTVLALGYSIGTQLIGSPASFVSLWLYKHLGWVCAPGIYFFVISSMALTTIILCKGKVKRQKAFV